MVFTPSTLSLMLLGVVLGLAIGIIPGLGGNFALAILIPFIYGMGPVQAFAFLLGAHSVVNTGGSISAVLLNSPGAAGNSATIFDGFPLAQKGRAGVGLGCALTASGIGGVIGALILLAMIPVIRPVLLAFAPPEFFMLILMGLSYIAFLGEGSVSKGIIAGCLGLLLAMVGFDPQTGYSRYNFGTLYLYDGIQLVPATVGLFAVAEMISLAAGGGTIAQVAGLSGRRDVWEGIKATLRNWWLVIRCSGIGCLIGAIPGLGGDVAAFIAYGHAKQTSRHREEFGKGAVEGVIAPESANNSKEGGALLPTIGFGVPGSAAMALLLGAFMLSGIDPGPEMLNEYLYVVYSMVMVLALANIGGAAICLAFANTLARITNIRGSILAPLVFILAALGSYGVRSNFGDVIMTFVLGLVGYAMKKAGYPRAPLLIGLVLGKIAELNFHLSVQLFGHLFFLRPIAFTILVLIFLGALLPLFSARSQKGKVVA